ncbi:MAG: hypothetical protein K6A30_04600 [Lachnospiraceae bacterium]|nr:hypothetical protein [Lachnospiraceae bacterium]
MSRNSIWNHISKVLRTLYMPLVMVVAVVALLVALGNVSEGQDEENLKQVQDTVKKAVVSCYSIEGVYPATLEYVEEYYGLQIDHDRYDVFYEIFADNIMPEITVIRKQQVKE